MKTQSRNENGGKGEVIAFSFLRKKKWLSAVVALIFLLNTCYPAWARDGNYGPANSLQNFGSGALAGAVTVVSCAIDPVGGAVGSAAGDLTGLVMFYNFYNTYGQTIKIGSWDTGITQGQFWSMLVGIGASAAAGVVTGMIENAGTSATEAAVNDGVQQLTTAAANATADGLKDALKNTLDGIAKEAEKQFGKVAAKQIAKKAAEEFIKTASTAAEKTACSIALSESVGWLGVMLTSLQKASSAYVLYGVAGQFGYAALTLVEDLAIGTGKLLATEEIKKALKDAGMDETIAGIIGELGGMVFSTFITPLLRIGLGDLFLGKDNFAIANNGAYLDMKNAKYADATFEVTLKDGSTKTVSAAEYYQLRGAGEIDASAQVIVHFKGEKSVASTAAEVDSNLRYASATFTVTVQDGKSTRTVTVNAEGLASLQQQGKISDATQVTVNFSDGTQAQASVANINQSLSYSNNATITVKLKDGSTKTVGAQEYSQLQQAGSIDSVITVNFGSQSSNAADLNKVFKDTGVLLLIGKNTSMAMKDVQGKEQNLTLSELAGAQKQDNHDGSFTWVIERKDGKLYFNFNSETNKQLNNLVKIIPSLAQASASTGGFLNNARGEVISSNGFVAGAEAVQSLGLSPFAAAGAKIAVLLVLGYRTHYGNNKDRVFENAWKMALADFFGNLTAGVVNNSDQLNAAYAGTTRTDENGKKIYDNPWQTRGGLNDNLYVGKELVSQLALLGTNVAWAYYCKQNNLDPGVITEFEHMAASSIIGGLADALFRRDPGTVQQEQVLIKDENGVYSFVETRNVVYDKNSKKYTLNGKDIEVITDAKEQFLANSKGEVLIKDAKGNYSFVSLNNVQCKEGVYTVKDGDGTAVTIVKQGDLENNQTLIRTADGRLEIYNGSSTSLPKGATAVSLNKPKEGNLNGTSLRTYTLRNSDGEIVADNQVLVAYANDTVRSVDAKSLKLDSDGVYDEDGKKVVVQELGANDKIVVDQDGYYHINPGATEEGEGVKYTLLSVTGSNEAVINGMNGYSYSNSVNVSSTLTDRIRGGGLFFSGWRNKSTGQYYATKEDMQLAAKQDGFNINTDYEEQTFLTAAGRFVACVGTDFVNYGIQSAAHSAVFISPEFTPGTGMLGFVAQQQNVEAMIQQISGIAQGISPTQLLAGRLAANLNAFANSNLAESISAPIANSFLSPEFRSYVTFITPGERSRYLNYLNEQEKKKKETLLEKMQRLEENSLDLTDKIEQLKKEIPTLEEEMKKERPPEALAAVEAKRKELAHLTEINDELTDLKSAVLEHAFRLGIITENETDKSNARILSLMPAVLAGLKAEIAGSQEKLDHSAGFGLNELITSGIVDYNVKRTLETNAPISNAAKDGLKTYIENNSELSRDQKNIYEAIVDHAATKELVSDYSFSVAGVYQGSETYANSPLLSVGNITPQLSLKINEAVLGNKELIAECEVIKQAPKTLGDTQVQLKETGKELEQKKAALEEAKKTNNSTEITKLADAIDTLEKTQKDLTNIAAVQEVQKNSPELQAFTWLPGDGDAKKQDVINAIYEIQRGKMAYSDYGLVSRTTVDRFGRAVETEHYAPEYIDKKWQTSQQDISTRHYYGPFGHAVSVTTDYTQIKVPRTAGGADWKTALSGLWDGLAAKFSASEMADLAGALGVTTSSKDEFVSSLEAKLKSDPDGVKKLNSTLDAFTAKTNEAKREVYFTDIRNKVEAAIAAGGNAIDVINQIAKAAGLTASGPEFRTFSNVEELIGAMKGLASDKLPTGEIIFRATTPAQEKIDREVYFTDIRNKVEAAIAAGGNAIDVINQIAKAAGLTASGPEFRTFSNVEELIGAMKGLASDKLPTGEITVSTTTPGEETTETKVKVVDLGFLYGHPEIIEAAARKVVDAEKNNQSFEGIIISSPDGKVQFGVTEISRKDANAKVDEYVDNPENAGLLTDLNRIHDLFWQGDAKREQAYAAAQYDKQIDAVNSKIAQTGQRIQASKDQIAKKQVELTPLQARKAALEADVAAQEKIIGDAKKPVAAVGSFFKRIVGANKDQDNKVAAAETALQGDRANLTDVNAQIGAIGQTVRRLTDAQQQSAAELTPLEGSKKELEAQKTAAVNNEAWQNSDVNIEGLRNTPWGLTVLTMIASGKTFDGKAWKDMTDAEKVAVYGNSVIMSRFMGAGFQRENGTTQDYTTLKIKPGNESAYTTRYHPIKNPSADSVPAKEGAPGSFTAIIVPSETTKTPGAPVTAQSLLNLELTKTEGSSALTINQPQSVGGIALQQPTYQEQPFSVGPNTSYEVSIYSSDNGHSAYAGPSARLNFADINSGPALQYNAQYAVRPDAVRQQLNKLTNDYVTSRVQLTEKITAFLQGLGYKQSEIDEKISSLSKVTDADELKQKTENIVATAVGNRAEVIRHAVSTEIGEQSKEDLGREITLQLQQVAQNKNNLSGFLQQGLGVDKALVATKLANLTYEQYIAGEKAQIQEYTQRINTVSEVIKDSKGDLNYLKSKLGPMVEKEQTYEEAVKSLSIKMGTMAKMRTNLENGISTGDLTAFAGWAGQELRSDKSISPGLDTRQQEMEQALNQDLSNVKQSQFAQYEKINDKALALPTWGLTTGYAVERKALYSEEIRTKGQPGVQLYKKQTQTVQDPDKVVFVLADFDYLRGRNNQTRENLGQAVLQGGGIETPNGDLGLKAVDKNEIIKLADEKIFNDPVKGKAFLEEATNQTHILYGRPHKQQLAILEAQIAKKQSEVDELKKNAYPAGTRGYQQQSITIQREEVELAALKSSAQGETNYLNQLEQKRVTRESLTSTIWGLTYLGMVVKGEGTNSIGVMSGVAAISRLVPQKLYGEQVTQDPNTLKVDSGKVTAWTTSYDPVTSPQADAIKGGELKSIYLPVLITKGGTHTETQEVPDGFSPGVEPKVTPAQLIGYQYGSVPELRFTKFFDYSYDSANVRNSISQAQVEAARTGNKMLEELLTGIAVYPSVADSGRSFANEPNNKDILGAYYNRYTTLYLPKSYEHKDIFPEGASYEGRGTADIISQTDLFDNN